MVPRVLPLAMISDAAQRLAPQAEPLRVRAPSALPATGFSREARGNLHRWARPSAFYTEGTLGVQRAVLYLIGTDVLPYQRNPESPLSLSLLKKTGAGPFGRPRPVLGRKWFLKKKINFWLSWALLLCLG